MKRIIKIFLTLLIICSLFLTSCAFAGDEENPEVTDEINDIFGPLIEDPDLFSRMKATGRLGDIENFDFIDIVSAWFYENSDEPDFLYSAVKVKNLEFKDDRGIYAMHWVYNDLEYGVGVHTHSDGKYKSFFAGISPSGPYEKVTGSFDLEKNIVTFRIPKILIGYPSKGDILTQTDAWNALRFKIESATWPYGGELAKDWAGYGQDYEIQYDSFGVPFMYAIYGATAPIKDNEYNYMFRAIDPDQEDIYYLIDWGDGTTEETVGPFESGEDAIAKHVWTETGEFNINAKALDKNGYESNSLTLNILVKENKALRKPIFRVFENHPILYRIINYILKL